MRTRRMTRRAQVLEAHAVVIGALLSALARLIHRRCRQMRLAAGPACTCRVSPRTHTIPYTTSHTGTCSGARTCARFPMSTCTTSHTHTAPLSHDTLVRTCAHAHAHSQTDHFTHADGISQKRHTHAHTWNKRTHTQLPTYTHTHMNTHRHTKEHARTRTYRQTFVCMCDTHMPARAAWFPRGQLGLIGVVTLGRICWW